MGSLIPQFKSVESIKYVFERVKLGYNVRLCYGICFKKLIKTAPTSKCMTLRQAKFRVCLMGHFFVVGLTEDSFRQ